MKKILLFPLLLLLASAVHANCPLPQTISFQCHDFQGHKMCTWQPDNGWYQGSADDTSIQEGTRLAPGAFKKAVWFPYVDDNFGATNCFYVGPRGEKITLFQQTGYGSVPRPAGKLWKISSMKGYPYVLACLTSASECKFEFGERT